MTWLALSDTERTFDGLKDLIVKEQFIDSCPKDLAIHLRERAPETLAKIGKIADQYLEAHGKHLFSSAGRKPRVQPESRLDFQPFCEPAFLAPHHGWITGLPIVFLDQSQRSLLKSSRLPRDWSILSLIYPTWRILAPTSFLLL